jgi:uncharacterized small protein (DUF1192 family)
MGLNLLACGDHGIWTLLGYRVKGTRTIVLQFCTIGRGRAGRPAMHDDEDDAARKPKIRLQKLLLDPLGVAELQAYIEELRGEIARVEAEIGRKQSHRSAADAFFQRR